MLLLYTTHPLNMKQTMPRIMYAERFSQKTIIWRSGFYPECCIRRSFSLMFLSLISEFWNNFIYFPSEEGECLPGPQTLLHSPYRIKYILCLSSGVILRRNNPSYHQLIRVMESLFCIILGYKTLQRQFPFPFEVSY